MNDYNFEYKFFMNLGTDNLDNTLKEKKKFDEFVSNYENTEDGKQLKDRIQSFKNKACKEIETYNYNKYEKEKLKEIFCREIDSTKLDYLYEKFYESNGNKKKNCLNSNNILEVVKKIL